MKEKLKQALKKLEECFGELWTCGQCQGVDAAIGILDVEFDNAYNVLEENLPVELVEQLVTLRRCFDELLMCGQCQGVDAAAGILDVEFDNAYHTIEAALDKEAEITPKINIAQIDSQIKIEKKKTTKEPD